MELRLREAIYVQSGDSSYLVRAGSVGFESKQNRGIVNFYDNTRTTCIGFDKEFCLNSPRMFEIRRELTDKEVPIKETMKVLKDVGLPDDLLRHINEQLNII